MSSPINYRPRMSPQHFNALSDFPQESEVSSEGKKNQEASQRTLNTNFEPNTRKRARQEDSQFQRAPILRLKIPRRFAEGSGLQQPFQPEQAPLSQTISSDLDAPINDPQPAQEFAQSSQIIETPLQPNQEGNPKKFRPLSARAIKDARQVVLDKMNGLPVNDQRLKYAEKTLEEYDSYETNQTHTPKKVSKEAHNSGNKKYQDRMRAWGLAAAARADAPEDVKKRARRLELYMEKFPPERQAFIRKTAEDISQNQITLEEQENERFREFAEEISQIQSD